MSASGRACRDVLLGIHLDDRDEPRWIMVNTEPSFDQGTDEMTGLIASSRDISDKHATQQLLRQLSLAVDLMGPADAAHGRPDRGASHPAAPGTRDHADPRGHGQRVRDDRAACLAAGMDGHVWKPVDPHGLYEAILRWLAPASA